MSIGQLPDPKAGADLTEAFRKKFSTKRCMAPFKDHEGNIVSAHTLSVEAVLRKIAKDSHVYAINHDIYSALAGNPINIKKLGIRDVSVFYGFCAKHDLELFSCIENEPFTCQPQQNFILCYRAAARECYLKRNQYESIPTPEQIGKIHKIKGKLQDSESISVFRKTSLKGAEEIEAFKSTLDIYLLQDDWSHLETHFIVFPKPPCLAASFVFPPFFDMDGTQLQNVANLKAEMSYLAISVIPYKKGGIAIFSWLDTANAAPLRFFMSVMQSRNLTSAIIHVVLDNCENFAISPEWYEKLLPKTQKYIISRIQNLENTGVYFKEGRPDMESLFLDDWGAN
jgi:hypothetical protein